MTKDWLLPAQHNIHGCGAYLGWMWPQRIDLSSEVSVPTTPRSRSSCTCARTTPRIKRRGHELQCGTSNSILYILCTSTRARNCPQERMKRACCLKANHQIQLKFQKIQAPLAGKQTDCSLYPPLEQERHAQSLYSSAMKESRACIVRKTQVVVQKSTQQNHPYHISPNAIYRPCPIAACSCIMRCEKF